MRKIRILFLLSILMSGCAQMSTNVSTINHEDIVVEVQHEYSEIEHLRIEWYQIFDQELDSYYVYFYSLSCSHCNLLKNEIIDKALKRNDIFFVRASKNDVLIKDVKNTIGATFATDFGIIGYPSLAKIDNHKVTKNVAGKTQILNIII